MKLKNYQEDVVLRAIEIALEDDQELLRDEDFVNDVAAFVLNRVPPRYVMSERGFLRLALEHADEGQADESLANVIELMMLVNRGVELVRTRRPRVKAATVAAPVRVASDQPELALVHNYPQFIGRVVEASTGAPVYGAVVTMTVAGDALPAAHSGWENPYVTHELTRGHFSFWPQGTTHRDEQLDTVFGFSVAHPDFLPFSTSATIATKGAFRHDDTLLGADIVSLPPFMIARRAPGRGIA
ncbi:MAG: hypothetical protein EA382_03545 [Spirochaetaceae bacterium]|nr:MAG: hypothetical protein EA382_03545 [Spirochaetaceae bacterium]